jgi:hypothetical protein
MIPWGETEWCGDVVGRKHVGEEEQKRGMWTVLLCRNCGQVLERRRPWAAWKAQMLNELFGGSSHITAASVERAGSTPEIYQGETPPED